MTTLISDFAYAILVTFGVAVLLWMGSGTDQASSEEEADGDSWGCAS